MNHPHRATFLGIALAAAGLLAGCTETPTGDDAPRGAPPSHAAADADLTAVSAPPLDPSLLQRPQEEYKLGPGDQIAVEVVGNSDIFAAYPPSGVASLTVGPDGRIYYYILPGIDVWGLTLAQARDRIAQQMQQYVRQAPPVSVSLISAASSRYWILGRISNPGVYNLSGATTLLDAIANGGGLASGSALASLASSLGVTSVGGAGAGESADLAHAFLIRDGRVVHVDFQRLLREGDLSQNIYLQPGDFIYLPSVRSPQIHVLGAVNAPTAEPIRGSLTIVQAIALAGGTVPGACLTDVAILRGSVTHPQIGVVSVRDIIKGKATDVRLEAGDVVYVPMSPYVTLERYANLVIDTFARTVGVNEGARAASSGSSGVGVGISVSP